MPEQRGIPSMVWLDRLQADLRAVSDYQLDFLGMTDDWQGSPSQPYVAVPATGLGSALSG
jgi:hypothetical protein